MGLPSRVRLTPRLLIFAAVLCWPAAARSQSNDLIFTRSEMAELDSLASRTAHKIREAKLVEDAPKVLVIDFFRSSPGNSSQLGELLADRFSASLAVYAARLEVLDRKILQDFLTKEWTTLEDLNSNETCLAIGRQMGATGVIVGTLYEENGYLSITVHLEGFGLTAQGRDGFPALDDRIRFPQSEELHNMLFQHGPNYARTADKIPPEPGVFSAGVDGVTPPSCTYSPAPDYLDAARAGKFQGTVILSAVITPEGQVTSVYVLKGAPFGLTAQTIKAIRGWRCKPGEKEGKPLSVRTVMETTFRLY